MNQNCMNQANQTRTQAQSAQETARTAATPVIPLPDPGDYPPAYPGDDAAATPVVPLPEPGDYPPAYPGDDNAAATPVIPLPDPGDYTPAYPGNSNTYPGNNNNTGNTGGGNWLCPGCGGAVIIRPGTGGGVISSGTARVRFLNAAYGYSTFRVFVGNNRFVNMLNYASVTSYGQVRAGYQTVTVSGTDGYVYIQKTMPFQSNGITTIAIINTASGMDLLQITDNCCPPSNGYSSFRVGNLAINSGPLDVIMSDGRVVYSDLRFKEVAAFKRIMPGVYQFFYADTDLVPMPASMDIETLDSAWLGVYPPHETFGSLYLDVVSNAMYTIYLLQSGRNRNNIQNLILMDR